MKQAKPTYRVRLLLYLIGGSGRAYCLADRPKGEPKQRSVWLPKSQIKFLYKSTPVVGLWQKVEVSIPRWLMVRSKLNHCVLTYHQNPEK